MRQWLLVEVVPVEVRMPVGKLAAVVVAVLKTRSGTTGTSSGSSSSGGSNATCRRAVASTRVEVAVAAVCHAFAFGILVCAVRTGCSWE